MGFPGDKSVNKVDQLVVFMIDFEDAVVNNSPVMVFEHCSRFEIHVFDG